MSVDATIEIHLGRRNEIIISKVRLIKELLNYGWTFNDNGKISYLPIGDNDQFQWRSDKISAESLMSILRQKEENNEIIGVAMTWENTDIGGEILLMKNGELLLSLSINRKRINDDMSMNITDVNWYLTKLLPAFNKSELLVEGYFYTEHV